MIVVTGFSVAYLDKTTYLLIDDPKKIAWKCGSSWLALDIISTIPSELAQKVSPKSLRSYGLFNMLRLWRLRRVNALFLRLEKDKNYNNFWVRCAKLICVTLFTIHCAGCFYGFCCTISWSWKNMDWSISGRQVPWTEFVDSTCDINVLVYHYTEYRWLWGFASCELCYMDSGKGIRHGYVSKGLTLLLSKI